MKRMCSTALLGVAGLLACSVASALPNIICKDDAAGTQMATWAGEPTYVWCRVQDWDGATQNGTYNLDCDGDGTLEVTAGVVNSTNANDFGYSCTYPTSSPGKVAKIDFFDDTSALVDTAQVLIAVDGATPSFQTKVNQAIDGALKALYHRWVMGSKDGTFGYTSYGSTTAGFDVLPFITKGTKPGKDATERATIDRTKIYGEVVHTALGYIQTTAEIWSIPDASAWPNNAPGGDIETGQPITAPPGHSAQKNGKLLYFYNSGYAHPIITLGLIASDPTTVAWAGPVAGQTFESIVQDSLDACYGAMRDSDDVYRGGWRYGLAYNQDFDGSAMWCALAINEAQLNNPNGITVPDWVETELNYHTTRCPGNDPTYGDHTQYAYGCGYGDPRLGGNLMQLLAIQDIPYTNAQVQGTMGYIGSGFPGSFMSAPYTEMYGSFTLAKGMRGARDASNQRHVVDLLPGGVDWYQALATNLVDNKYPGAYGNNVYPGAGEYNWYGLDSGGWLQNYAYLETGAAAEILLRGLTDLPPVANAGGPYSFLTSQPNKTVTLDGCASFHQDPSKAIAAYQWDVNGDGVYDFTRNTCTLSFDGSAWYPDTGSSYSKTITLRVRDNGSPTLSDTDVATMNVQSGNPQVPPVANPGGPVYAGYVNVPITFDGSRSYDPNDPAGPCGSPLQYRWDVTGDGVPDTGWLTVPTYSRAFAGPTSNRVTLEVMDSCGAIGTSTANVNVSIALIRPVYYHVKNVRIISRNPVKRTVVYEITAALTVQNGGNAAASNITLQLLNGPPNWVLIPDPTVNIKPVIQAGAQIRSDTPANLGSTDQTFVFRVDTGVAGNTTDTFWQITQYDENGQNPTTYQASWALPVAP